MLSQCLNLDKFIEVPLIDAFSKYDDVFKELVNYGVDDDNIYILMLFNDVLSNL